MNRDALDRLFDELDERDAMPEAVRRILESDALGEDQKKIVCAMPWKSIGKERVKVNFNKAEKMLNAEHYGMDDVKQKVLELLAVRERVGKSGKGILLVGPAGTGKTTISRIIAKTLEEPFEKINCTGIIAQWEITGCNPGWKDARQGLLADAIRRSGSFSAVVCFDEVDKIEVANGRNPQMALLPLLDSTNVEFVDKFMEVPMDVSNITYILTANKLSDVTPYLRDRVDVIEMRGYTPEEKRVILKRYIIPKLMKRYNIGKNELKIRKDALEYIVNVSMEEGVRDIERLTDNVFRRVVYLLSKKMEECIVVDECFVKMVAGYSRIKKERGIGF